MPHRRGATAVWVAMLAWLSPASLLASPPESQTQTDRSPDSPVAIAPLHGRVLELGPSRAPVPAAVVMVVNAPADIRPGKPADSVLDPEAVKWMHRAETDAEGRFVLPAVPVGKLRIVIVAGGYGRLEQWAELKAEGSELELRLEPERDGGFRTEVVSTRVSEEFAVEPDHTLDGQEARHYAGSGDDPLLAALNLPGVARTPGGLGLVSFRGGDPTEVGVYIDGHPVPRAFHVIPIASVLSAPVIDRIQISPGNYAANYGSFGGGLVTIDSRAGRRDGIHGQAHIDLFDVGGNIEGAVGKGSVNLAIRRSHAGDVLRLIELPQLIAPNFWDYFGRFDYPLARGHSIGVRALGAGDRLLLSDNFDFRASFHRFDFDWRFSNERWEILVSPSIRVDASELDYNLEPGISEDHGGARRDAQVYSLRAGFRWIPLSWLALDFGTDVIVERWRRRQRPIKSYQQGWSGFSVTGNFEDSTGEQLRLGAWLAVPLRFHEWSLIPSVRANVFHYGSKPTLRFDPRLNLRAFLSGPVQLVAAAGMYATPVLGGRAQPSRGYLSRRSGVGKGVADIPQYLIKYFDPNIEGEVVGRSATATHVIHASMGFEAKLPWDLDLRAVGFWRGGLGVSFDQEQPDPFDPSQVRISKGYYGRSRASGFELLLRRSLAPGIIDGWLGYTLMWARVEDSRDNWLPAVFDQRHNFVALISVALPRDFRLGLRFRLGSGNPLAPITGREIIEDLDGDGRRGDNNGSFHYRPLRGPRGTEYQPLFHQLDIRVDKTWTLDRVSVGAYLDVQNVYNRTYPEVWIYSSDWSARRGSIGLPIYPSLGVQVNY